jgi:hypothetical protein
MGFIVTAASLRKKYLEIKRPFKSKLPTMGRASSRKRNRKSGQAGNETPSGPHYRWELVGTPAPDAATPATTIERIAEQYDGQFDMMREAFSRKAYLSALILMYAAIDALAWLDRRSDDPDVSPQDFRTWVSQYLLRPPAAFQRL